MTEYITYLGKKYDASKYRKVPDPSDIPPSDWNGYYKPDMILEEIPFAKQAMKPSFLLKAFMSLLRVAFWFSLGLALGKLLN